MAVSRSAICKRRQIHAVFNLLIYQLQIIFPKLLPERVPWRCCPDKTLNVNQTRRRFSLEKFKAGSVHSYSVRLKNNLLLPSLDIKQERLIILFGAARDE